MAKNLKTLEKSLLEKRRKQLKDGLFMVGQALNDKDITAASVNKIKNNSQWLSALNKLQKNMVSRAEKVKMPKSRIDNAKQLIKNLKPKWNSIK